MALGKLETKGDLKRQLKRWFIEDPSFHKLLQGSKNGSSTNPRVGWLKADFGAEGDGNAATGTGTDDLVQLNNAIAALNANEIDALMIEPGVFILSAVPNAITASDYLIEGSGPSTILRFASSAARGTFFTVGQSGGTSSARGKIRDFAIRCNATGNTPPADEQAFQLVKGGTTYVTDIYCTDIGGLCKIGTTDLDDRMQLYGFFNIFGSWNQETPDPSRIYIVNGTNGRFKDVRLTATEVNGGYGIHAAPTSKGVDQHFFTRVEAWGMGAHSENIAAGETYDGIDWNVFVNFTGGQVVNWVFTNCVFDEGREGAVRIFADSGNSSCRDMHFLDCHYATNAGRGFLINHGGTGILSSLQISGGRIRYKDAPAIQLEGADVDSVGVVDVDLLHESSAFDSASTARDSIVHSFKHGRAVDQEIVFTGSPPAPLVAGTSYYVKDADANSDEKEFTLAAAPGGATIDITASDAGAYFVAVDAALQQDDVNGVRMSACYIGPFQGATTATAYAAKNLAGSGSDRYAIVGNVSRAMVTGFDNGYATSASQVVASNAVG